MTPSRVRELLLLTTSMAVLAAGCCGKSSDSGAPPAASSAAAAEAPSGEPVASAEPSATPPESAAATTTTAPPKPTAPPATNTAGANAVKACCNALNAEAAKAKGPDKAPYQSAAGVCGGLVTSVQSGKVTPEGAKRTIRAQLQRAKTIPPACR